MFCKKCGRELKDGTKFCDQCGTPQNVEAPRPCLKNQDNCIISTKL